MQDIKNLAYQAYEQFNLNFRGKKVPTPYRMNEYGKYQAVGPEFQGKSSPETLITTTKRLAAEQNFDLDKASIDEIRDFMQKNKLGIDCSGFIYRALNYIVLKIKGKPLTEFGFDTVGRTNIAKLSDDNFSIALPNLEDARPGDFIKLNTGEDILHGLLVLDNQNGIITYAHSSRVTPINGVHIDTIKNGKLPEELNVFSYKVERGDGLRRLKILI